MNKFDWEAATRINTLMLKFVGLWPEGDGTYNLNIYTIYAVISINLLVNGHTFFQVMNIFFVFSNLQALTATIFITASEVLVSVKVYKYVQNLKLLKKLKNDLEKDIFQPTNEGQILLIEPHLKMWKVAYFVFCIPSTAVVALFAAFPILDQRIKEYRLPFSAWYPYNTKISPLYELTYLYQVIAILFMATVNVNTDILISALMMYVAAQCDILCDELRNLNASENIHEKIIICVRRHQALLG
ncbi:odorant receptor Or1-like [Zophobas morio]|uniref:odorant receptor Or1-like n=1 Tax=Zophobas morio TaxID=2755281 RepID=UPI0030827448